MKILFLDIDGVANCAKTMQRHRGVIGIDPYMAFMIGKIQIDTGCEIVLSSSWRHSKHGIDEVERQIAKMFDVTGRVRLPIGAGAEFYGRGKEIKEWLDAHPEVERYAIIDDDSDMLPEQMPHFFQTTWENGLTEEIARKVTDHLNS